MTYEPAPVPGQPVAPVAGQPAGPAKTNTLAIVAIITVWFGAIFGLIFGYVALSQIKKTGESGRGLALASVIIGWIYIALGILITIIAFIIIGVAASQGAVVVN